MEELMKELDNMSEEEAAEALLNILIQGGSKAYITRNQDGKLMRASILDDKGCEEFAIVDNDYVEPKKKEELK